MLTALFRGLLHLLAFSALCAAVAWWFVQLRAPLAPIVALPAPPIQPSFDSGAQPRLFGGPVQATALSNVQVAGVIAPREGGSGGIAALVVDGKPVRAYRAGQFVAPGLMLVEVHATRVVFEQNGARAEVAIARAPAGDSGVPSGDGGGVARTISEPPTPVGSDGSITFEGRPGPQQARQPGPIGGGVQPMENEFNGLPPDANPGPRNGPGGMRGAGMRGGNPSYGLPPPTGE
ncbi:hypothetical protein [Derxia lacustris]|uniref:hypothetical protein n=1 Tax=Derxia lacustris TaxID=764842 RepID=UPI000A16DCAB|nr:hypothetical protein [Derxia lacustris]